MASPVAVIPTPDYPTTHMLFFLNGYKQQLALELRSTNTAKYIPFHDNGVPKGVIVNPSSVGSSEQWRSK
jgi:galactose mutarotase-like enzyme